MNSNHLWDHKKEIDRHDVQSLLPLLAVLLALADCSGITERVPKSYHGLLRLILPGMPYNYVIQNQDSQNKIQTGCLMIFIF